MYVSFGDIKGMSNIKDVEQQSCCCCCYHGKKIYNFPFLFFYVCQMELENVCIVVAEEKNEQKSMEPSQNGNLNIFQMCFPFAKKVKIHKKKRKKK